MNYTLWRRGVLLGRTDLAMQSPGPRFRAGQLEPTVEFERVWPELGSTLGEFFAAGAAVGSAVADLPPAAPDADPTDRGRQVYERLSAHPAAARLRAASEALNSLGLELRDAAGRPVATQTVMVQEVRPPAWIPASVIAHEVEEARREGLERHRANGYVTTGGAAGLLVSLPDETELLDDEFLRDHCVEASTEQTDGVFALHFRPTHAPAEGYGIRGTIWLGEHFLIRRLEFEYLKGDTAWITSTVRYADISVAGGTLRLASNGEAGGRPEGLAMVKRVSATFNITYRQFERVRPD